MPNRGEIDPTREELDQSRGAMIVEFGASWCGQCLALKPHLERMLEMNPEIAFRWVEDGPGQPLGRSYQVKLWPTLLFLRDGRVMQRSIRPSVDEVRHGLELLKDRT